MESLVISFSFSHLSLNSKNCYTTEKKRTHSKEQDKNENIQSNIALEYKKKHAKY